MTAQHSTSLSKPKIFYGWYIVAGLTTVGMVSAGMGGINFGLFLPPMVAELGIKHTFFGWALTARLVGFSASSWLIGRILDQHGARIPMAVAGTITGLIMMSLGFMQEGWHLVALFFIMGAIGMHGGGENLYQAVPLSRWFVRKRGKAMSIAFLGIPIGIFIFSPLSQFLIDSTGWRSAWFILGGGGSIVIVLVGLLIIRKDPQSMGLSPDGDLDENDTVETVDQTRPARTEEYPWTRSQAIHTPAFWAIVIMLGIRMFSVSTIVIFRIPFYIEQGISAKLVAWALSAEAVIAATMSLTTGWASDRFHPRLVTAVSLLLLIIAIFVTIYVTTPWQMFLSAMLFGASAASAVVSQNVLWPSYFGVMNIGSIRGLAAPFILIFSGIGAPVAGAVKDATGTYAPVWLAANLSLVPVAVIILLTPRPKLPVNDNKE
ncbi:MFS transporter [Thermodesulfobacteriota bacterium]